MGNRNSVAPEPIVQLENELRDLKMDDEIKAKLEKLAVRSPSVDEAKLKGIHTTQSLSSPTCTDIEQYTGVHLATIWNKEKTDATLFLSFGVFYTDLKPIDAEEFVKLNKKYHRVDQNFAFCIYSLDEFVQDVCVAGDGYLYWPRTDKYYAIPPWYIIKCASAIKEIRTAQRK